MPHINRIRVNNVKYNFGTQVYDDFLMKPFCKNTLYDLANGGGKSVLMLLLLQNMIPNCTLDEKQPIEKLFRTGDGSKTIHSLIEWRLDEEDIKDGFCYMTTGFCAKKASETEEESKETASIEYFNYCIFYREYNENDIRNLPLVKDKERITYSGLRKLLKELEKNAALSVKVFDRKGEYQSFISQYGIYESEWEIIRGINKTEGHVRTYFETNYKTTRKVVEDLLIEEILGTSIRRRAGREDADDTMSKTLLDMKDKLVELAKQKDTIKNFDRQEEVLNEFSARVDLLGETYKKQKEIRVQLNRIYNAALYYLESRKNETEALREQEEELQKALRGFESELLCAALAEELALAAEYKRGTEYFTAEATQKKNRADSYAKQLVRKECANDYLEYLEEKKKRNELAVTLQAMNEKSGLPKEIAALVRAFAKKKEEKSAALTAELLAAQKEEEAAARKCKTTKNTEHEVEGEAVATKALMEQVQKELSRLYAKLKEQKEPLGLLLTEDAPMRLYRKNEQKKKAETKQESLRGELQRAEKDKEELYGKLQETETAIARLQETNEIKKQESKRLAQEKERADKLAEAYGEKDYRKLCEAVRIRFCENYSEKERTEKEKEAARIRRQRLEAGNIFAANAAAETVKEYIISRYHKNAQTGAEYLEEKSEEEQKELLERCPGLPFFVVTEGFAQVAKDHLLAESLPEDTVVPVICRESVQGKKELFCEERFFVFAKDGAALLSEKERKKEIVRLSRVEEEAEYKLNRLNSLLETYREDEEFLTGFVQKFYTIMYSKKAEYGTEGAGEEELIKKRIELQQGIAALSKRLSELFDEEEKCRKELAECETELQGLNAVKELNAQIAGKEKEIKGFEEKLERLKTWKTDAVAVSENAENEYQEKKAKGETLRKAIAELEQRMEGYSAYLTEDGEGPAAEDMPLDELYSVIDGKISALHAQNESTEDKQRLLDSYVASMNRMLRSIRSRGMSLAEMAELHEKNEVYETSEEELLRRKEEIQAMTAEAEELFRQAKELEEKQYRLEGKNSRAEEMIIEKYGEYHPVELSGDALSEFVEKRRACIAEKKQEVAALREKQEELTGELSGYVLIQNEIEHLFEGTEELSDECGRLENNVRLGEYYKETRERYSGCAKELAKRQEEFYRNRQTTMDTLQVLGAQALAGEIAGSIVMPKNLRETEDIIRGLKEVTECLQLERTRIEAGLGDLETMKENFEQQCLQRCINIKADLERLPKLSKIMLDGEQIPILSLQIPYVKEEFFGERMTQYINQVIREVDAIAEQAERMKYIKAALSYKRLFSVIVTDMNAIRLMLYKRERVKEQSRMLRYEEAVGSTGQSQGIYIQFLIAVINYISNIYSPKGDAAGLRKVLFIDNPFGAAKDVYIWEPIFELLRANRVQLIVPARGVTPAITGRFDVNYVLGQKLIDGRQQTVIVDYCSSVEAEAMEYIPLQYEQTSLNVEV